MGAFFTNLQIRKASAQAASSALQKTDQGRAYVSPDGSDWVTVYPESTEDQNDETLRRIASGLSKTLKTDVFGFLVHDSDIAVYWLFRNGELADEFNSAPHYFETTFSDNNDGSGGNPDVLLPLCLAGTTRAQLEQVLHPSDGYPIMAEEIVGELARLLGIDKMRSVLGFNYFEGEGEEILPDVDEFLPVGKGAERKKKRNRSVKAPVIALPDTYSVAIGMLTQVWNRKHTERFEALSGMFDRDANSFVKQLRDGFDRSARDMLKKSKLPNLPTIEELKAAREQGPEALAALIAKKTPGQLTEIGIGAALSGLESFLAALFNHGLDPSAPDSRGCTTLQSAETHGLNSAIYRLANAAAQRKSQ